MKILIAVTHLLGAGHLTRAAALARAFAAAGHETVLVSGGRPAPLVRLDGVRLVQLPPLHSEGFDFGRLVGPGGEAAGSDLFALRKALLLDTLAAFRPDAVLTELFPFGRRGLAEEFLALVEAARLRPERPLILSSVRDILVPPDRQAKVDEAHERVAALYDAVLVHGDPALAPLDASWPVDARIAGKLTYTGYVDEGGAVTPAGRRHGVLVAAGSSAAGLGLFRTAIAAARLRPDLAWRILVGHFVSDAELDSLSDGLPPQTVMRARPDYRALLAAAAVSVSQCGYNTAIDLMVTGTPSVLVPFEAGRETEQRLRAERLAALGGGLILSEDDLSPTTLLAAVLAASSSLQPNGRCPALDGSARSVSIVEGLRRKSRLPSCSGLQRLRKALDLAAEAGRPVRLWWRDDDAVAATPALDRLLDIAGDRPILVAAIPAKAEPSLGRRLLETKAASLAVHGLTHADHAPRGEKSAEFGPHRPLADLCRDAETALRLARRHLPADRLLPVFVPPWNRIAPALAAGLAAIGYEGLSAAGGPPVAGLARVDAGLDLIDWRGTRSLRDPEAILAAIATHAEGGSERPLGLLTHHLAHDGAVWDFLAELIPLLDHPGVRWDDPRNLFESVVDAATQSPISIRAARPRAG